MPAPAGAGHGGNEAGPAPRGAAPGARAALRPLRRPEVYVPALYAALAGLWIATSDALVAAAVRTVGEHANWSTLKGFGFVAVTALLLHAALRKALARERDAHERLARSEALLRAVSDATPDPVFLKDRESRWLFANPAAARVLERPPEELVGLTDREIYPDPEIAAALIEADRAVLRSGRAEVLEERIQTAAGYRVYLTTKAPYRDADGAIVGVIGSASDITERKAAEEALREQVTLKEQVRQAQKLESIGRLAGGVAHDFNNLLTVILGCAEALGGDATRGARADPGVVDELRTAGERARDLTRQLLAFARRHVIAPVPLDLNGVVRGAEKLLRRVLGEDVELLVRLEPGLPPIRGDAGQLEQAILNLAVNARDAMPRGGTLALETRTVPDGGGDHVSLVVRDSGTGMTPEVKAHLFEPFFTTKPPGEGTGLGLAMVYGIVRQSEGQIHVDSDPGRGTTFELRFPRAADLPAPAPAPAPPSAPAPGRGTERILVVEDDALVREVTVRALRAAGHPVLVAASAAEALALGAAELAAIDLVVTDVVMPRHDGRAVSDELRRRRPDLRVLYVSGYTEDAMVARGVLGAGLSFLAKPFTPSALVARVRAILDAR
jgi:PAS domain S-box-containing protein